MRGKVELAITSHISGKPELLETTGVVFGDWVVHPVRPEEMPGEWWSVTNLPTSRQAFVARRRGAAIVAARCLARHDDLPEPPPEPPPFRAPLQAARWLMRVIAALKHLDLYVCTRTGLVHIAEYHESIRKSPTP